MGPGRDCDRDAIDPTDFSFRINGPPPVDGTGGHPLTTPMQLATRHPLSTGAAVLALAGALVLAAPGRGQAVAHGQLVQPGQYDAVVRLDVPTIPVTGGGTRASWCTATFLSPQWLISAGHCFHDLAGTPVSGPVPYRAFVVALRADGTSARLAVTPDRVVQAPGGRDIALLHLKAPLANAPTVGFASTLPPVGKTLRLVGWGRTDPTQTRPVSRPRTGLVTVTRRVLPSVFVRGRSPQADTSACLWDSGAPYLDVTTPARPLVATVESGGPTCPHAQEETTTAVSPVAAWITRTIA
jgi:hypothetical protein